MSSVDEVWSDVRKDVQGTAPGSLTLDEYAPKHRALVAAGYKDVGDFRWFHFSRERGG